MPSLGSQKSLQLMCHSFSHFLLSNFFSFKKYIFVSVILDNFLELLLHYSLRWGHFYDFFTEYMELMLPIPFPYHPHTHTLPVLCLSMEWNIVISVFIIMKCLIAWTRRSLGQSGSNAMMAYTSKPKSKPNNASRLWNKVENNPISPQ